MTDNVGVMARGRSPPLHPWQIAAASPVADRRRFTRGRSPPLHPWLCTNSEKRRARPRPWNTPLITTADTHAIDVQERTAGGQRPLESGGRQEETKNSKAACGGL
uniref:Uncharacterized protein n=1 Tax=Knipowitschia caucasica TaxID=637954 RepID=A0AAV2M9S1_KNICA